MDEQYITIEMKAYDELIGEILKRKQKKLLDIIDERLDTMHNALKNSDPFMVGLNSVEEVEKLYKELLEFKKTAANYNTFKTITMDLLNKEGIRYEEFI